MRTSFGWLALLLLFVSVLVHLAALLGVDVQDRVPIVWVLHLGVFVVFLPAVLAMRKWDNRQPLRALLSGLPTWARAFTLALAAYVVINFAVYMVSAAEGQPAEKDHRYVLEYKGKFVRELTADEYHLRSAQRVRGFSGHWMAFYFVSFAVLVLHNRKSEPRNSTHPPSHVRSD